MATQLPSQALRRVKPSISKTTPQQTRHASLLRRPHRPYTFTQLVHLSDGSTYLTRTTSPLPIYRSTKDTRNSLLWQPSLASLKNVEQDEAGRLRAFRQRFGRGWDLDAAEDIDEVEGGEKKEGKGESEGDSLMDLISAAGGSAKVKESKKAEEGVKVEEQVTRLVKDASGKLVKVVVTEEAKARAERREEKKKIV